MQSEPGRGLKSSLTKCCLVSAPLPLTWQRGQAATELWSVADACKPQKQWAALVIVENIKCWGSSTQTKIGMGWGKKQTKEFETSTSAAFCTTTWECQVPMSALFTNMVWGSSNKSHPQKACSKASTMGLPSPSLMYCMSLKLALEWVGEPLEECATVPSGKLICLQRRNICNSVMLNSPHYLYLSDVRMRPRERWFYEYQCHEFLSQLEQGNPAHILNHIWFQETVSIPTYLHCFPFSVLKRLWQLQFLRRRILAGLVQLGL